MHSAYAKHCKIHRLTTCGIVDSDQQTCLFCRLRPLQEAEFSVCCSTSYVGKPYNVQAVVDLRKKTRSPTNSNSARCLFSVRSGSCTLERRIYLTGRQWHRVQSSVWSDEMRMGMGCIAGCCCCCWFCHAGADVTSLAAAAAADLCIYDKQTIGAFLLTACMRTQRNTSRPISANADGPRDAASRKIDYNALFF